MMSLLDACSTLTKWTTEHPRSLAMIAAATLGLVSLYQPLQRWRYRKLPGPTAAPIIGHLPQVVSEGFTFFVDRMCHKYKQFKLFTVWMGPYPWVVIRDPELGRKVLNKLNARFSYDMMSFKTGMDRLVWQNLMFTLTGQKWRLGRRAIEASVLHPKALAAMAPVLGKCTTRLVQNLERYAGDEPVDVQVHTFAMAMDAVGWAAFGVELHAATMQAPDEDTAGSGKDTYRGVDDQIASERQVKSVTQLEEHCHGKLSGSYELTNPLACEPASLEELIGTWQMQAAVTGSPILSKTPEKKRVAVIDLEPTVDAKWWRHYPVGSSEFGRRLVASAVTCMRAFEIQSATIYTPLALLTPCLRPIWDVLSHIMPDKRLTEERKAMVGLYEGVKVIMEAWRAQQERVSKGEQVMSSAGHSLVSDRGFLAQLLSGKDLAPNDSLEEYEAIALAITAVVAGYDTTGMTVAMCLHYLAHNHEAQAMAQEEVDRVLEGREPTMEDLDHLPYISAIFQETLRLSGPTPSTIRVTDAPFDAGDGVMYHYQHSPDIWPSAHEFLPARHIQPGNEDIASRLHNTMMPFGGGARLCAGYKFATMEVRMALAGVLQRLSFSPAPNTPTPNIRTGLVMSHDQVMLCVHRRACNHA